MNDDDNRTTYGEKAADFAQFIELLIQKANSQQSTATKLTRNQVTSVWESLPD